MGPGVATASASRPPTGEGCTARGIMGCTMMSREWKVAVLLLLTGLFGCHRPEKPIIAVIPETTAQEAWESAHFEALRIGATWKLDTFWNGPSRAAGQPQPLPA